MTYDIPELGRILKTRRYEAHWSQQQLARKSGLSEVTIRNIEKGHHELHPDSLMRLLEVPELRLTASDLPTLQLYDSEAELKFYRQLNFYLNPEWDQLKLSADFGRQLARDAGHIDQTYLYLDAQSAADYLRWMGATPDRPQPQRGIVDAVLGQIPQPSVDVIALGPGDGEQETRLVQRLLAAQPAFTLRYHLLDTSQPLLTLAYRRATAALGHLGNVAITGLLGSFYDLPIYQHLFLSPKMRPATRLLLMLGGTLGNIDNEIRFFRHSLSRASPGDLLLVEVRRTSSVDNLSEAAIRSSDPLFRQPFPVLVSRWLGGPIRRYCDDGADISFDWRVSLDCVVPGSYVVDAVAKLRMRDGRERILSMLRARSYDTLRLVDCVADEGWRCLAQEDAQGSTFILLCKGEAP
jgi:transcriptional regulator with XRE-family HTH domain